MSDSHVRTGVFGASMRSMLSDLPTSGYQENSGGTGKHVDFAIVLRLRTLSW
jgi:hypothetical protein